MVKEYRGGDIRLEPPNEGWGILWFCDGYKAQVSGAKIVKKEGQEMVQFYLMPFEATAKRFNIDIKKDLDANGHCLKWYPKETVKSLNTYDPSRRIFFCLLNWDGKETESTKWFKGIEQANEIIRLRSKIREIQAHNERLKEENFVMKTNVEKYIQDNLTGIIKPMIPALKGIFPEEGREHG